MKKLLALLALTASTAMYAGLFENIGQAVEDTGEAAGRLVERTGEAAGDVVEGTGRTLSGSRPEKGYYRRIETVQPEERKGLLNKLRPAKRRVVVEETIVK